MGKKPHKVIFAKRFDHNSNRWKNQEGVVVNYLLNGVVEVQTKDGKLVRLYKHEYTDK